MSPKRLDGIVGPVFRSAREVDWSEVREEWEELTGKKLQFSFWRGLALWLILVGVFVYLQAGFFGLYFSRPYLEAKTKETADVINRLKGTREQTVDLSALLEAEDSLKKLKTALSDKGQFFVFLAYNPLFQGKVVDLSRSLLLFEHAETLKNLAFAVQPNDLRQVKWGVKLALWKVKEGELLLNLIQTPEMASYKKRLNGPLSEAKKVLSLVDRNFQGLAWASGLAQKRRYLVLFPNNKELRNWGGFSGTYGILELDKGKISLTVRDIYYLDYLLRGHGELRKPSVANSIPLELFPDPKIFPEQEWDWYVLRNTPTSLDFGLNARRAKWVFENVHQQGKVDGVVALTPNLVIEYLKLVGPVKMPEYKTEISAVNFREVIEYKVEVDNPFRRGDRTKDPKQILRDLAPKLLQKLEEADLKTKLQFAQIAVESLNQKQVLLYFENPAAQRVVEQLHWGGRLRSYPYDYLAVYTTNLNGRKSSLAIKRKIGVYSTVLASGLVKNRVNIVFSHEGKWRKLNGSFIEGDVEELVEIAVPKGAMLRRVLRGEEDITSQVGVSGELDKTIFFLRFHFNPGEKMHFTFEYTLPQVAEKQWGLLFQKQPGVLQTEFLYEVKSEKPMAEEDRAIGVWQALTTDRTFSFTFE